MTWKRRFCWLECPGCGNKEVGWREGSSNRYNRWGSGPGHCKKCGTVTVRKRRDWAEPDENAIVEALLKLMEGNEND